MEERTRRVAVADDGGRLAGQWESDRDVVGVAAGAVVAAGVADALPSSQPHLFCKQNKTNYHSILLCIPHETNHNLHMGLILAGCPNQRWWLLCLLLLLTGSG